MREWLGYPDAGSKLTEIFPLFANMLKSLVEVAAVPARKFEVILTLREPN